MKKLKTGSRAWLKDLKELLVVVCPPLIECQACGRPTREGFVCRSCGSDDPGDQEINPADYLT